MELDSSLLQDLFLKVSSTVCVPLDSTADINKKRQGEGEGFAKLECNTWWEKKNAVAYFNTLFQYRQRISVWLSWKLKPQFLHIQGTLFVRLLRWKTEWGLCAHWHFNKNKHLAEQMVELGTFQTLISNLKEKSILEKIIRLWYSRRFEMIWTFSVQPLWSVSLQFVFFYSCFSLKTSELIFRNFPRDKSFSSVLWFAFPHHKKRATFTFHVICTCVW